MKLGQSIGYIKVQTRMQHCSKTVYPRSGETVLGECGAALLSVLRNTRKGKVLRHARKSKALLAD